MDNSRVAILLPARNEEEGIGKVIDEIQGLAFPRGSHVVVAEYGSTDNTVAIARRKGAEVICCPEPGKGRGVRYVLNQIQGKFTYIFMLDADNTYPARYISPMLQALIHGADVVVGVRRYRQAGSMSHFHYVGNRLICLWASILYQRWVTDTLTGMWGFYASVIPSLQLGSDDFTLEADIFSGAMVAKVKIAEVPIEYRPRLGTSKLEFNDVFKITGHLWKRRFTNGRV